MSGKRELLIRHGVDTLPRGVTASNKLIPDQVDVPGNHPPRSNCPASRSSDLQPARRPFFFEDLAYESPIANRNLAGHHGTQWHRNLVRARRQQRRRSRHFSVAPTPAAPTQAAPTQAPQTEPTQLDAVTTAATRTRRTLLDVPATVSVTTSEDIERENMQDIRDLTRNEPGVTVGKQSQSRRLSRTS